MKVKKVFPQPPVGSGAEEATALSVTKKLNPVRSAAGAKGGPSGGEIKATGGNWSQMKANEGKKSFPSTSSRVQGSGSHRVGVTKKLKPVPGGPARKPGQNGDKQAKLFDAGHPCWTRLFSPPDGQARV